MSRRHQKTIARPSRHPCKETSGAKRSFGLFAPRATHACNPLVVFLLTLLYDVRVWKIYRRPGTIIAHLSHSRSPKGQKGSDNLSGASASGMAGSIRTLTSSCLPHTQRVRIIHVHTTQCSYTTTSSSRTPSPPPDSEREKPEATEALVTRRRQTHHTHTHTHAHTTPRHPPFTWG